MAYDRVPTDLIALTHEFLSVMLGVRRPGVTECLNALAKRGLIKSPKNGAILLVDSRRLGCQRSLETSTACRNASIRD